MVKRHAVEGYAKYSELIKQLQSDKHSIFIVFSGSKNEKGESWCPDCVAALPTIEKVLEEADKEAHYIYVGVGTRDEWKDPNCPFRKDPKLKLKYVPTVIAWGRPDRLENEECANPELVRMVFVPE